MKKKVGLIVDNPNRDLNSLVLIAYELSQRDIDCYLIPMNLKDIEVWLLNLDFILLNYIRTSNSNFVKKLIQSEIAYGVLDTEGLAAMDWEAFLSCIGDRKNSYNSSLYCSWGKIQADQLIKNKYYKNKNVSITGTPRFDFYHGAFLENENKKLPEFLNKSKYILFNTTYTFYNPKFKSREREKELLKNDFGWTEEFSIWVQNKQKTALDNIISLAKKLSTLYPKTNIVVRPHPFENQNFYKDNLKDFNNIFVINDGAVQSWLSRALVLIHQNCMTAFESSFLNVPALFPTYFGEVSTLEPINDSSIFCKNEEEMIGIIDEILKGKFKFSQEFVDKTILTKKKWHHKIDGKSHYRIANEIENVLKNVKNIPINIKQNRKFIYDIGFKISENSFKVNLINYIRYMFNIPYGHAILKTAEEDRAIKKWQASDKMFNAEIVKNIIEEIHMIKKEKIPSVKKCSNDFQSLYKQKSLLSLKISC